MTITCLASDLEAGLVVIQNPEQIGIAPIIPCQNKEEEGKDLGITITLGFMNDNKLYTLLDHNLPPISGPGDDLHYSHGYILSLEKIELGHWRLNIFLSGDLYGKPIDGEGWRDDNGRWHVPQHFVDDFQLKFEGDTRPRGQIFYLSGGAGIEILNSNNLPIGLLAPSTQQTLFHDLISDNSQYKLKNRIQISDEKQIQVGGNLSGGAGIQVNIINIGNKTLEVVFHSELMINLSTINKATNIQQETGLEFKTKGPRIPIVGKPLFISKANSTVFFHSDGVLWAPELIAEVGVERLVFGLLWRGQYGELHNYQGYNLPHVQEPRNDDLMQVYLKSSF